MFNKYPTFVVDYQRAERERIAAEEEELHRKRYLAFQNRRSPPFVI